MKNYTNKLIIIIVLIHLFFAGLSTIVIAFDKTNDGIVYSDTIPKLTDEEFSSASVILEVFVREWCKYCETYETQVVPYLTSKYSSEQVSIRFFDIDHKQVKEYLNKYYNSFTIPDNLIGHVPAIIINKKYMVLGYSAEITKALEKDIQNILNGIEPNYSNRFVLKPEYEGTTDNLFYSYDQNNQLQAANSPNDETTGNYAEYMPKAVEKDSLVTLVKNGVYNGLSNPGFMTGIVMLMFFVSNNKKK